MSACAGCSSRPSPGSSSRLLLIPLIVVVAAVGIVVTPQLHATLKHPTDAALIRGCLDKNGPYQVWRDKRDSSTAFLLCQLPDMRWGFQIAHWDSALKKWIEKTSFVKGGGTWREVVTDYISKFAVRFTSNMQ